MSNVPHTFPRVAAIPTPADNSKPLATIDQGLAMVLLQTTWSPPPGRSHRVRPFIFEKHEISAPAALALYTDSNRGRII